MTDNHTLCPLNTPSDYLLPLSFSLFLLLLPTAHQTHAPNSRRRPRLLPCDGARRPVADATGPRLHLRRPRRTVVGADPQLAPLVGGEEEGAVAARGDAALVLAARGDGGPVDPAIDRLVDLPVVGRRRQLAEIGARGDRRPGLVRRRTGLLDPRGTVVRTWALADYVWWLKKGGGDAN